MWRLNTPCCASGCTGASADPSAWPGSSPGRCSLTGEARGWPTDDVLLCVSELATNALLHGVLPGRGYRLRLWSYADGLLRVEVHDSGDGLPHIAVPADESGRGLLLVQALADAWGVDQRKPGKVVWCEWRP